MLSTRKNSTVVGLDIEAGSVAAAEVATNGVTQVRASGVAALDPGVTREGEVADPDALARTLKELFADRGLSKSVRLGIANQRVVVRTLRLPAIADQGELETAIRFQAQDQIPMPLDQAVLDWQIVPRADGAADGMIDVIVVAARRDMVSALLDAVQAAGLRPVGIDLSAFGMIRALEREAPALPGEEPALSYEERITQHVAEGGTQATMPARLLCSLGEVTNLAVARDGDCLFTRASSFGVEGIAQRLAERRGLTLEHARQWLVHVGLNQPVEVIDGDPEHVTSAREALAEGAAKLADELRLSLEFYAAQEVAVPVEEVVACGPGTMIDGLVEHLQRELSYRFRVGRPDALAHLDAATAARLTLSYGLALNE